MNVAQQIFSIFYAISYGAMLASLTNLKPFPWAFMGEKYWWIRRRLFTRLLTSLLLFNLFPFSIYIWTVHVLDIYNNYNMNDLFFMNLLLIISACLAVQTPYRLYHALFIICHKYNIFKLYTHTEYLRIVKSRTVRQSPLSHLAAAYFYLLPVIILSCLYGINILILTILTYMLFIIRALRGLFHFYV